MDLFDDHLSETTVVNAPAPGKFRPKAKARPKKGTITAATPDEAAATADITTKMGKPIIPDVSFASSSPFRPCTSQVTRDLCTSSTHQSSLDIQLDVEELETRNSSSLDTTEMLSEGAIAPGIGKRAVKLTPKPKVQDVSNYSADTPAHLSNDPHFSSENEHVTGDGSKHAGEVDPVSNTSHTRPDSSFSSSPIADQSEDVVSGDTDPLISNKVQQEEKLGKGNVGDASHSFEKEPDEGPVFSGIEANIDGSEFSDGINEGFHENSKPTTKSVYNLESNGEEIDCGDQLEEGNIQKKRGRRSKVAASENGKPAGKRKKAPKESHQSIEKAPKKFRHGTSRRRNLDKALLEAPEDALDLQKLPIKDLILLGEHKERVLRKQGASVPSASTNERNDNFLPEEPLYDDADPFGYDQDRDSLDNPSTSGIKTDTGYFNYHTYMQKESRVKWSKKDTELFYQGIRQFGSDFSMIMQLFPGRTRNHIKLKFKKEERQNPLMVQDAMANKAKDFSHFELVIERLQEEAAKDAELQASGEDDDTVHRMGEDGKLEEDLETQATSQDAAKHEHHLQDDSAQDELHKLEDENPTFCDKEEEEEDYYPGLL